MLLSYTVLTIIWSFLRSLVPFSISKRLHEAQTTTGWCKPFPNSEWFTEFNSIREHSRHCQCKNINFPWHKKNNSCNFTGGFVSNCFIFLFILINWRVCTSVHSVEPISKPLTFQTKMGWAEFLLCPTQDALHSRLLTCGESNHCHCAASALGVAVLFFVLFKQIKTFFVKAFLPYIFFRRV